MSQVFLAKPKIVKVTKCRVTLLKDRLALLVKLFYIEARILPSLLVNSKKLYNAEGKGNLEPRIQ
jgi:hypothetical protein